ncbi:aldose 1-epimerase family protein [Pseudomonas sp. PS02302]|uniref:aldose 1-epimerase family protein n=1 Tax=Pseudomonas sp. PS02302 TaxID=2991428 RepID=UPI00249A89C3|nr:aldose 1-epimerase family protein [Pseudomonas sp. PS02302]
MSVRLPLQPEQFTACERSLLASDAFQVRAWIYPSGVRALALENRRGRLIVLPYQGQMVWDACFDGCRLTMPGLFDQPRPTRRIIETYGCFMFHAGVLRNGCPAPEDGHELHGELPCAPLDEAWLELGRDAEGDFLRLGGRHDYGMGFGDRYRAQPSVTLRPDSAVFELGLEVENQAGQPMDLMYMAHMNYAYVPGGRFHEPLGVARTRVRTSVPAHVRPTADWQAFIAELAEDSERLRVLDAPARYQPEIVSFIDAPGTDAAGEAHFLLEHPGGAAFYTAYRPAALPHATRWVLHNPNQQVAAFVLPATCEPEGYLAETAKGQVQQLQPGERRAFSVRTGYLAAAEREALLARLADPARIR